MIRKFHHSDMDQVISVWLETSIQAHDFIECEFWRAQAKNMREVYLPAAETYVCEEDGIIKGFVSLAGDTLAALFVSPVYQRAGIGKQLILQAKKVRETLNLSVYTENSRSVAFYRKCGFVTVRVRIDEQTGHSEMEMEFNS